MKAQQQKQEPKEPKGGKVENDRTDDVPPPESKVANLKERILKLERWGVLPPKMRDEMLSTSGVEAPAEYREIISRYYERMNKFYEPQRKR